MRVLYAALRHDPRNPDLASGVDYNFYNAIYRFADEVRVIGPFKLPPPLVERAFKKLYTRITGKKYLKWDWYSIRHASRSVSQAAEEFRPDAVFTIFPATVAFYTGTAPYVFNTDTSFRSWQAEGAGFGDLALRVLSWIEHRAVCGSARIIAHSAWGKKDLVALHGIDPRRIDILVMPSALPPHTIPARIEARSDKRLADPLKLLLVGRDYHRKGVDIALSIVRQLKAAGIPSQLTVCGTSGENTDQVRFVGPFRKSIPEQLAHYVALYQEAHLLLHPARFEPAGIVPGEAAAFGTPTITNDTGGLGTTVNEKSGIVLPKGSPPEAYVKAITDLVSTPDRYYALCESARARYERELNWDVAGKRVAEILRQVVDEHRANKR